MEIDRKTLKALAADTRLDILKSLGKRRKTPSELSKELNLAPSTIIEHLNKLEEADLIKKEETGHKWIYYSLTKKGLSLVKPKVPTQFIIVLSLCFIVLFAGCLYYVNYISGYERPSTLTTPFTEKTQIPEEIEVPEKIVPTISEGNLRNITNTTNTTP